MSLFLKKEEVFSEITKIHDETLHFIFDESRGFFYVTIHSVDNQISFLGMMLEQEGFCLLANYFLFLRHFSYEEHLDTLKIYHHNKVFCFIRYHSLPNIILEQKAFIERFLYQVFEALLLNYSGITILGNPNHHSGPKLIFKIHHIGDFVIECENDKIMKSILKKYIEDHPDEQVSENDFEYVFDKVSFSKLGISKDYEEQLNKEVSLMSWIGYQSYQSNSLIHEISRKICEDERLKRKRTL